MPDVKIYVTTDRPTQIFLSACDWPLQPLFSQLLYCRALFPQRWQTEQKERIDDAIIYAVECCVTGFMFSLNIHNVRMMWMVSKRVHHLDVCVLRRGDRLHNKNTMYCLRFCTMNVRKGMTGILPERKDYLMENIQHNILSAFGWERVTVILPRLILVQYSCPAILSETYPYP